MLSLLLSEIKNVVLTLKSLDTKGKINKVRTKVLESKKKVLWDY